MLGEKIKELRKENKLSQEELAEKLCISEERLNLWEKNQMMPSSEKIIAIAEFFDVSLDELLREDFNDAIKSDTSNVRKTEKRLYSKILITIFGVVIFAIAVVTAVLTVKHFNDKQPTESIEESASLNKELSAEEVYDLISPSMVEINSKNHTVEKTGLGCFIESDGLIITNYHIIENCHTIKVKTNTGNEYEAESVLGFDKDRDLAIIKIECKNKDYIELNTEKAKTGEKVYTLEGLLGHTNKFYEGVISSASKEIDSFEFIQITAPIPDGNSGGPLVDRCGNVIGITTDAFVEANNLNLVIPVSKINEINRSKTYSINEFYQLSKDNDSNFKENQQEDENYTPKNIGSFDSLAELEEESERNPLSFERQVITSISGLIVRTENDEIYLCGNAATNKGKEWDEIRDSMIKKDLIIAGKHKYSFLEGRFKYICKVNMKDDTQNRVLTGDTVIITGVYNHNDRTISNCTYKHTVLD